MVKHYNPSLSEDVNRHFNTKAGDQLPSEVAPFIQPTKEIKRVIDTFRANNNSTTGSATIFTTPSDKDFYLTSIMASLIKDATCDVADGSFIISVFINGSSSSIINIPLLTTTAQEIAINRHFDPPIKLDRNTAVSLASNTFTGGKMRRYSNIAGYTVEVTK